MPLPILPLLAATFSSGACLGSGITYYFFKAPTQSNQNNENIIKAMMQLGRYYEVDQKADRFLAFDCYLTAAKLGDNDALTSLEKLAEHMDKDRLLQLSLLYKDVFKNDDQAKHWQDKVKELTSLDDVGL
ncbi:MAG: hypothetical protein ACOVQX_02550 [Legionella sp.]